jgi:proteasome lid subunit RPN8/RPN11
MKNVNVNIFPSAFNSLKEIATRHSPNETGGVLTGTRTFCDGTLEFNILGTLGVADFKKFDTIFSASSSKFICIDRLGWANFALEVVKIFGMSYIGDWHSHPNCNSCTLSYQDVEHLVQQFKLGQFNPFPPLHILLSNSLGGDFHMSAYIMLGECIVSMNPHIIHNHTSH